MTVTTYQAVPISCPNCKSRFVTPVLTIVDAAESPEAKALLLSGQANIAVCSQCGFAGTLSTPMVYHDPNKELLLTFTPTELGLSEMEQQRIIGDLTNRLISSLPAEQRKGYLLRPRNFLRLEGMIEAILEADGITPEMLEAQRARATLLNRLLQATGDEARRIIAQENENLLDYDFFQLLTMNLEMAQVGGQAQVAQQLQALRSQLLDWTATGREIAAREKAIRSLGKEITREGLLDKLVQAALAGEQTQIETMIVVARPAIDYLFYRQLTERIEAAEQAGDTDQAQKLKALRQTILDLTAQIDAEMQQAAEEADQVLQTILDSTDPEKALHDNLERVDDLFLSVLSTRLRAAEQAGHTEEAQRLRLVGDSLMKLILENQPPEVQFINALLNAEEPNQVQALLESNRQQVTPRLLEMMRLLSKDMRASGRLELAQRLDHIREQATVMSK